MEQVCLLINEETFKVKKSILCEHSDYFRAMFSGNYMENEQEKISIDVIEANTMKILIQYMEIGLKDLSAYSLTIVGELAVAANYLQIIDLFKQIEYFLKSNVLISNWMEIMEIAEKASYTQLEQFCAGFGLLSFRNMKPEYVSSLHKLCWYLSDHCLDAANELDVFKFGFQCISRFKHGADDALLLLMILACLDIKRLTYCELTEIKQQINNDYDHTLAAKVVNCLLELLKTSTNISLPKIVDNRKVLDEKFTESVVNEMVNIVKESKRRRLLNYVPMIPLWKIDSNRHMYTFSVISGFEKWLEVAEKSVVDYSIAAWGPKRLVVVCGVFDQGIGTFAKDVKVYDTLKKEWVLHGVQLPSRIHPSLAVVENSLFIVGGVDGTKIRSALDTDLIYDLEQKTYRKIASLPDAVANPAVCVHEGNVYVAGRNTIYLYEDSGGTGQWNSILQIGVDSITCMVSFNGYIYCANSYFSFLYRFKPYFDDELQYVTTFTNRPAAVSNLGDRLIFFTRTMFGQGDIVSVEEYTGNNPNEQPAVVWSQPMRMDSIEVNRSCSLVMSMPPISQEMSSYHINILSRFSEQIE